MTNRAERLQSIFDTAYRLHKEHMPITVDAIFKKLESKVPKVTISDDLKFMRFIIIPIGKQWVITQDGLDAAKSGDVFKFKTKE
jgi:hypothetical protein